MSDDAIAVTPPAAQPPQPDEAIYQALHNALSATSRGRWFLSEFARRNRNSESSKMLDAVARIEQAVATRPAVTAASADLQIARNWVMQARSDAEAALNDDDLRSSNAGAERGIRIIREIATSMRAVGNDPRICRILDEQLDVIEAAQRGRSQPFAGIAAIFDRLIAQLDELLPAHPKADSEARLAAVADLAVACVTGEATIGVKPEASAEDLRVAEAAEDEALLAVIAAEMGAPDNDAVSVFGAAQPQITPPDTAPSSALDSEIFPEAVRALQPSPAPESPAAEARLAEIAPAPAPEAAPDLAIPPKPVPVPSSTGDREAKSLGAALLAQGVLMDSLKPARDPFADLKRLTQAEKVALFT